MSSVAGSLAARASWQSSSTSLLSSGAIYHVKCVPADTAASSILAGSASSSAVHTFTDHPNLTFTGVLTPTASYVLSVRPFTFVLCRE